MSREFRDPKSIAGKRLPVEETTQLLVIGAGPAGVAAAAEAARLGIRVVLADENPVPAPIMGDDIPLHFGQRFSAVARNRTAMLEAFIARNPAITELFDAGVDVRLGTSVWGLYANGPSVGWLPGTVAGLQDGDRSFMLGCDRVIVASGRRDMGLAFPGWELPGVLGVTAAQSLLERFDALGVRRAVILGTSAEALSAARSLRQAGVEIAALVEAASTPIGPASLIGELQSIPLLCRHTVLRAEAGRDGVEAVVVAPIGVAGAPVRSGERRIDCDSVLLGVGTVPVIELLDAVGCRTAYQAERGGHVPLLDAAQRTSVLTIYAAGDCAGIWPAKTLDPEIARAEGRRAAAGVAVSLELAAEAGPVPVPPETPSHDADAYRLEWIRASVIEASGEPYVCQCEEVTARDILEVRPPRYLGLARGQARNTPRRCGELLGDGTAQPGPGEAPDPRRHGPLPGPALPRAGRRPAGPRRGSHARAKSRSPRYRAPVRPAAAVRRRRHGTRPPEMARALGHLVRHAAAIRAALGGAALLHRRRPQRRSASRVNASERAHRPARRSSSSAAAPPASAPAWWLAREGVDVLVIDKGIVGWEASGRNGGGCTHPFSPLFAEEQRLWPQMDELLGYPTEYRPGASASR